MFNRTPTHEINDRAMSRPLHQSRSIAAALKLGLLPIIL
jgi:hypothetical protein